VDQGSRVSHFVLRYVGLKLTLSSSMMLQWKYCKLVPYDEVIPLVEGKIDQGSITQMWNGM
jgi:hypothetical protein